MLSSTSMQRKIFHRSLFLRIKSNLIFEIIAIVVDHFALFIGQLINPVLVKAWWFRCDKVVKPFSYVIQCSEMYIPRHVASIETDGSQKEQWLINMLGGVETTQLRIF